MMVFRACSIFKTIKEDLKGLGVALRQDVPNGLTGLGSDKGKELEPFWVCTLTMGR
jgi:hypothetical protein